MCLVFGGVAQLGEHLPCKQGVMGSNPIISTILPFFRLLDEKNGVWIRWRLISLLFEKTEKFIRSEVVCVSLAQKIWVLEGAIWTKSLVFLEIFEVVSKTRDAAERVHTLNAFMPEWRNWHTCQIQNLNFVGSSPTSGTKSRNTLCYNTSG